MWMFWIVTVLAIIAIVVMCVAIAMCHSNGRRGEGSTSSSWSSSTVATGADSSSDSSAGNTSAISRPNVSASPEIPHGSAEIGSLSVVVPLTPALDVGPTLTHARPVPWLESAGQANAGLPKSGRSKKRVVLPLCQENERACEHSYDQLPFVQKARKALLLTHHLETGVHDHLSTGGTDVPESGLPIDESAKALQGHDKAVGSSRQPCDAHMTSWPSPFFRVMPKIGAWRAGRDAPEGVSGVKRFFVGIGINYVGDTESRLTSCWNDVDLLHNGFERRHGGFDRVWHLSDKPVPEGTIAGGGRVKLPMAGNLRAAWKELLEETRSVDAAEVVLVFSGHGTFRLTSDVSELTGQSDALILLDQLYYDYDVMAELVRPLPVHVKLLIVFDSCNSGSAANLPFTYNPLSKTVNQTSLHTDLINDVVMIAGCRDEQTSAAGPTDKDPSECTRVLLEVLKEAPVAGSLAFTELLARMRLKLAAANDTQIPQLSFSKPQLMAAKI